MRIKLNFGPSDNNIPIINQSFVNFYIHKCLGINNKYHDAKNNYSISNLRGGHKNIESQTESYPNGSFIIISSQDLNFINTLLMGVINNQELGYGMKFKNSDFIQEIIYDGWNNFFTLTPFIIKKYDSKHKYTFLTIDNPNFTEEVKNYLINKITKINPKLDLTNFDIEIDTLGNSNPTKVFIKKIKNDSEVYVKNLANRCLIRIHSNKEVADLLYNIGIGQSAGSGFGMIYKTENHKLYRLQLKKSKKLIPAEHSVL